MANETETTLSEGIRATHQPQMKYYVQDIRGTVLFGYKHSPYTDWPADDIQAFGKSQVDIIETELKFAKTLLLASNVNSAVVYRRGFENVKGAIEPVIIIGVDGEFVYPADAQWRPCRVLLESGIWLSKTCETKSYPMPMTMSDAPGYGDPISVLSAKDGRISEPFTVGAVMFGFGETENPAEPDSVYVLTCSHFAPKTGNSMKGNRDLQLAFPPSPSASLKRDAEYMNTRLREMLESDEADMTDALASLLTQAHANGLDPCLDVVGDATLPVSLQGEDPSIGDAWLQYQRKHMQKIETEERAFALEWRLQPLTDAPECNIIGYARAELGVAQRPAQSSTTTTLAIGSSLSMAPATLPSTPTCISPVLPTALFEVTDRAIVNELKKQKSPFIPNHGKLEDGMQLGSHSWTAFTEKSSVDHRAFFVSRNPAYVPKAMGGGLHVLDYGEVMIQGRDLESRFTFPKPGTAGAVVYEEREAGLLRPVAICVGVFSLPAHEEETCLILPLSDVVPHLEAVVQQRLLFSCYNN